MIRDVHPGSRIRILTFTHPGSRGQKGTGSRIRISNNVYNNTKIYRTIGYRTRKKLSVAHLSIFLTHN